MSGEDAFEGGGGRRFDPREFMRLVVRFGWIALVLAVLGGVGGAVWTSRQPRIYSAISTLEYEPNPPRPLGRGVEDVADPFGNFWASREFFDTQNRVISSRNVLDRVVRQLALHEDAGFHGHTGEAAERFEGSTIEATSALLGARLTVEPVPTTRLVNLVVQDSDPERAANIANAIGGAVGDAVNGRLYGVCGSVFAGLVCGGAEETRGSGVCAGLAGKRRNHGLSGFRDCTDLLGCWREKSGDVGGIGFIWDIGGGERRLDRASVWGWGFAGIVCGGG